MRPFFFFLISRIPAVIHFWCTEKIIAESKYNHHVCLSVCLSAWNNLAPTGRILKKFCCSLLLLKYVDQIQVKLIADKTNMHFTSRPTYFYHSISLLSSWDEKKFLIKAA
jgi:hypothetical protein